MGVDPWVDKEICPPYFLKWKGRSVFCPPTFSGVDNFSKAHSIHWMIKATVVKFSQLILMKIIKIVATRHQMSDFKAKTHQIQFRLGLCPRSCWGAYRTPPSLLTGFKGPSSKEILEVKGGERSPLFFLWI